MSTEPATAKQIFLEAVEKYSPEQWPTFLDGACRMDPKLRREVEELLKAHQREDSLFDIPPTEDARRISQPLGESIGKYKLLQKIGEGGFGVVYMAEQTRPVRRNVALKIIKPGMDSKEVIARFEAERQALAMMDHPNIAKVLDGGETDSGHPYFVMELVKGIPLTKFCDENRLDTRSRLGLFRDVCNAIQHAHQKGVIHRDIKPSNVMVTLHDGKPVPKVIDFGVSKAISQQLTTKTLFTQYGQMIGTPQYMSPEQAEMSGLDIDTRSDIYSLGVLLYELLTGTTPLDPVRLRQTAFAELQRMIREDEPPKPSRRLSTLGEQTAKIAANRGASLKSLCSTLQGELDWIAMKALDKDRNRRYDTAKGFALDVDRYLAGEAVSACPPTTGYLLGKLLYRYRVPTLVVVVMFVLLIAGLAGTGFGLSEKSRALRESELQKQVAIAEREKADKALRQVEYADLENNRRLRAQSVAMAFDAFNSGNMFKAKLLLDDFEPEPGTALSVPYNFIKKRCSEQVPFTIPVEDDEIACFAIDPKSGACVVGLASGRVRFLEVDNPPTRLSNADLIETGANASEPHSLAFSADGNYLAACFGKLGTPGAVKVWQLSRDKLRITGGDAISHWQHNRRIEMVRFLGKSEQLALVDDSGTMHFWNFKNRPHPDSKFETTHESKCGFEFSPNEEICVTYGWEGTLTCRTRSGTELWSQENSDRINNVSFSPDGRKVVVCGYFGTQVWDISTAVPIRLKDLGWRRTNGSAIFDGGKLVAITGFDDASLKVYDLKTGRLVEQFADPSDLQEGRQVGFSQGYLVSVSGSELRLYRTQTLGTNWKRSSTNWFAPFASSNNSPVVAFPAAKGHADLWNTETQSVWSLSRVAGRLPINALAITQDGTRIAVSRRTPEYPPARDKLANTIEIWDCTDGKSTVKLEGHDAPVYALEFSPVNNDLLVSSGSYNEVLLWDIGNPKCPTIIDDPESYGSIISAKFSPKGNYLVVGANTWQDGIGEENPARLFRVSADKAITPICDIDVNNTYCVAFTTDEKLIAFCESTNPVIELWDIVTRDFLRPISVGSPRIMSIDFSPNDECLVAASPAGEISFLDYRRGELLGTFQVNHPLRNIRFIGSYRKLVASSMDNMVFQWEY